MPYSACAILLLVSISNSTFAATLADLHWMVGSWSGSLGPQTVEEAWSTPRGGTMSTMIRLTSETSTNMVELIVIREENDSLILHLRQFSPALELRLAQDMPLNELSAQTVTLAGPEGAAIKYLAYRNLGSERMEVDVTTADDTVLTAGLTRN